MMRCSHPTKVLLLILAAVLVLNLISPVSGIAAVNNRTRKCKHFESIKDIPKNFFRVESCQNWQQTWQLRQEAKEQINTASKKAQGQESIKLLERARSEFSAGNYKTAISLAESAIAKSKQGFQKKITRPLTAIINFNVPFLPRIAGIPPVILLILLVVIIVAVLVFLHRHLASKHTSMALKSLRSSAEAETESTSDRKAISLSGAGQSGGKRGLEEELRALTRSLDIFISGKETRGNYQGQERQLVQQTSSLMRDIEKEIEEKEYEKANRDLKLLKNRLRQLTG